MKKIVSIDIGSKNLHVAEGGYEKGKLVVNRTESYGIHEGSLANERVASQADLREAIQFVLKLCNYNDKNAVVTMNAAEHAIIKELDFPKAKKKELDSMVRNEMFQVHNIMATDIIQYKKILSPADSDSNLDRYRVASISEDFVSSYYDALRKAGLKPLSMDLNINAIDKLFEWTDSFNGQEIEKDEATLLIDFGHSVTSVYIGSKGQAIFYRHIGMGSGEIDKILAGDLLISPEEIKGLKADKYFFDPSIINSDEDPYSVLRPYFYRLSDEIRKVLTFYRGRYRNIPVNRGYTFGNGSQLNGYSQFWDINLNMPIEPLTSLKGKNSGEISVNPSHINAIAALIRN